MHLTYCHPKPGRHSGGYQVRSGQPGPGQSRFFADKKLGGKDQARARAEAFMLAVLPHAPTRAKRAPSKRNKSGVAGVRVVRIKHSENGMSYLTLVVSYQDRRTHEPRLTSISMNKWGVVPAIARAIELRALTDIEAEAARVCLLRKCGKGT